MGNRKKTAACKIEVSEMSAKGRNKKLEMPGNKISGIGAKVAMMNRRHYVYECGFCRIFVLLTNSALLIKI